MTPDPWLEPATARAYVQFCDKFHRYSDSSQWLVEAALSVRLGMSSIGELARG